GRAGAPRPAPLLPPVLSARPVLPAGDRDAGPNPGASARRGAGPRPGVRAAAAGGRRPAPAGAAHRPAAAAAACHGQLLSAPDACHAPAAGARRAHRLSALANLPALVPLFLGGIARGG